MSAPKHGLIGFILLSLFCSSLRAAGPDPGIRVRQEGLSIIDLINRDNQRQWEKRKAWVDARVSEYQAKAIDADGFDQLFTYLEQNAYFYDIYTQLFSLESLQKASYYQGLRHKENSSEVRQTFLGIIKKHETSPLINKWLIRDLHDPGLADYDEPGTGNNGSVLAKHDVPRAGKRKCGSIISVIASFFKN